MSMEEYQGSGLTPTQLGKLYNHLMRINNNPIINTKIQNYAFETCVTSAERGEKRSQTGNEIESYH